MAPISEETASANALLPYVLRRGTERCPDMETLSAALDELYGGSIEPMVRKKGETQAVGFAASFVDDAFAPGDTRILESAAGLLGDVLLRPAVSGGRFLAEYVEGERANLVDRIHAQINEKRSYSILRLTQEMCAGEPYGVDKLGMRRMPPPSRWKVFGSGIRVCSPVLRWSFTTAAPPARSGWRRP